MLYRKTFKKFEKCVFASFLKKIRGEKQIKVIVNQFL